MTQQLNRAQRRAMEKKAKQKKTEGYRQVFLPKPIDEFNAFQVPRTILEKLEHGAIETIDDIPVVMDNNNEYQHAAPVLAGWLYTWIRIKERLNITDLELEPLAIISRKLHRGKLITQNDLKEAKACLAAISKYFRKLDRGLIAEIGAEAKEELDSRATTLQISKLMRHLQQEGDITPTTDDKGVSNV